MSGIYEADRDMFHADCARMRELWERLGELNSSRRDDIYLEMGFPPDLTNDSLFNQFRRDGVHKMVGFLESVVVRESTANEKTRWDATIHQSAVVESAEAPLTVSRAASS